MKPLSNSAFGLLTSFLVVAACGKNSSQQPTDSTVGDGDGDKAGDGDIPGNGDGDLPGDGDGSSSEFRKIENLNDVGWRFMRQDFPADEPAAPDYDDSSWLSVTVPHDFNGGVDGAHDDVFDGPSMYLGPGWYRGIVPSPTTSEGKRLFLKFEAVSSKANVWLNGQHLGEHRGGYTAFEFEITDYVNRDGDNTLVVKADNTNDPEIAPWMAIPFGTFPRSSDYALYGGMYRDVWLIERDVVSIDSHFHQTPSVDAESGVTSFRTTVENTTGNDSEIKLITEVLDEDDKVVASLESSQTIPAGDSVKITGDVTINSPHLWSPKTPYLYSVRSTVLDASDTELDQIEEPLGFRWFSLQNNAPFILNGEDSFLQGVNRHQDMEGLGYALPNEQHQKDVALIKGLGFNFVRHAHYPADEAFLDACDEAGLMVWLEIPVSTAVSDVPAFLDNAKSQLTEMIEQAYNHPSVILWGIGNESDRVGEVGTEADPAYTTTFLTDLNAHVKTLDTSRPTTGCNYENVANQAIVDIYAPQEWSGWYVGEYTAYMPSQIIGEYGASIHLPDHDESFVSSGSTYPWPQEYGTEYHEYKASIGQALKGQFPGHLVWVAFDFASPRVDRDTNPIPYMNQKGLFLHDHQTPKDVAYFYESYYTSAVDNPMVYLVSETWLDRITAPGTITLWAYSNADTVELFNGTSDDPKAVSLGTQARDAGPRGDTRFQWDDAELTGPVLTAEATVGGEVVATHSLTFEGSWSTH